MHLNDIYHVGLPLSCMMCYSLNNNMVHHLALHPFVASIQLQPSFCWAEQNATAWCQGSRAGMWQQIIRRFRACLHGQINHCNDTSIITTLELELCNSPCGESYSTIRVPFLCSAYVALKGIIIPI